MRNMTWTRAIVVAVAVAALVVTAAACSDDDDGDGGGNGNGDGGGSTVEVTLKEFEILLDRNSVPAGSVTFRAENIGPDDPHELVVVRTDLAPAALPTKEDGAVDEEGAGIEVIGEIEEFAVGETQEMTLDLEAGAYVLLCNIVEEEDGETESHYAEGMHTAFTVE